MKMYVQLVNVDDNDGWGAGTTCTSLDDKDLALPLDEFVERYLKPAFVSAKNHLDSRKPELAGKE